MTKSDHAKDIDFPTSSSGLGGNISGQKSKKETHRLQLLLTEKSVQALDVLQDRLEASTTSEAVRRSILLALSITDALVDGGRVVVEKANGDREVLLIS